MPGYWVGFAWLYKTSILKSDTFYKHSAWLRGWLCLAFEGFYNGSILPTFCYPHGGGARTICAHVILHKHKSDTRILAVAVLFVEHLALLIVWLREVPCFLYHCSVGEVMVVPPEMRESMQGICKNT